MRKILFNQGSDKARNISTAESIFQRASLGETEYGEIMTDIWDSWQRIDSLGANICNHPRQVLAALCHLMADRSPIKIRKGIIMERFNVGRSYQGWVKYCEDLL